MTDDEPTKITGITPEGAAVAEEAISMFEAGVDIEQIVEYLGLPSKDHLQVLVATHLHFMPDRGRSVE